MSTCLLGGHYPHGLGLGSQDAFTGRIRIIALQCPESGLLHVQSEHLLVEVLDEKGRQCEEGEIGQIVVTDLHNFAMPLVRYALSDWAEVGPVCSCGRGLPTLRRVMGRTRNMAMSPQGQSFWPVLDAMQMLQAVPQLKQYQLEQTARDAITGRLVCAARPSADQLQKLQATLHQMLGHSYHWTWRIDDAPLPLTVGGKFEEFISLIQDCPEDSSR